MEAIDIVASGTGFQAIREYLRHVLPEARLQMIDPEALRRNGARAFVLIPMMAHIDRTLMDRIDGLRLIQQWGAGLEGVDVAAASERGIAVANVPTAGSGNAESVAEWCVMAAMVVSRRLPALLQGIRAGAGWGGPIGGALLGRTAGIIGLGGIGQALAARLKPFGMRLLGLKRTPDPALAQRLGLDWMGGIEALPSLLRESNYVFLCLPLNDSTRGLIDERAFVLLPDKACIINPSRGGLLSEKALLTALSQGRLLGAGLDVFEHEPLDPASPLLSYEQVLATPHIAGVTDVSYQGIATSVANNIRRMLTGRTPQNCVNAEAITF
jgi:phosphoglycerate dehydrogenase-like enzyme